MHEHHIVEKIINQVAEKAKNEGVSKITKVSLALGELSGLAESSVRLYFETISIGTAAEGAELIVKPLRENRELYLESIEVE